MIVEGANTNTGAVAVYDGTLAVLGTFTVTPYTVAGSGNPQITGQPDPTYWVTATGLMQGNSTWASAGT